MPPRAPQIKKSDMEIEMSIKFAKQNIFVPELRQIVADAMWRGFNFIRTNFESLIMKGMIFGGAGWYSVEQLPAWKWLNSQEGFAQLGFTDSSEPIKLLLALVNSFEVNTIGRPVVRRQSVNMGLEMKFFDINQIAAKTIHPAAGTGNLDSNRSWFDWVYRGLAVTEPADFTKVRSTSNAPRSSAIAGSAKGIMKNYGTGLWSVPPRFRLDLNRLISKNEKKITSVLERNITHQMNIYLRS